MSEKKPQTLLRVENLSISFDKPDFKVPVLNGIGFSIQPNEIVAIVGESGSGKSITSLAIMGLLSKSTAKIISGSIEFLGSSLLNKNSKERLAMRGKAMSMIFQEPMSALNPSMRCGKQVEEVLLRHRIVGKKEVQSEVLRLFEQVKLPHPDRIFKSYPHEISGGQKQRVMIAMAIACKPQLLIADEPTTALDVTVQKEIIDLLKSLQKDNKMSILFISHDLALVSEIADRVLVMYQGRLIEEGRTEQVFKTPKKDYTKALVLARPSADHRLKRLPTVQSILKATFKKELISASERENHHQQIYEQDPILEVKNVSKYYLSKVGWFSKNKVFKAVNEVSFKVYPGETLGLVGESGCGKSTLSNAITLLIEPTAGRILFHGKDITQLNKQERRKLRKDIQVIFQDPFASLNPRRSVEEVLMEPIRVHGIVSGTERKKTMITTLERVGLSEADLKKYPHEFSGGQRQRIGIARAIILNPKLVICDESVSALDISVQAQVLNLLNDLKDDYGFTYLFISHDLNVVKYMSDQLLVMKDGIIEEQGDADAIFDSPQTAYTKKLIHAIPKGL